MAVFEISEPEVNEHEVRGRSLLQFGNQVAEELVRLYRMGKEMLWGVPGYTTADAQATIESMGDQALPLFVKSAALGALINSQYPGILNESELSSPVPYSIVEGAIVLDAEAEYPLAV
jgi:hypothetical protein